MYKIIYLPIAKSDLEEIIHYITYELKNSVAAINLIKEFEKEEKNILTFPYGVSEYQAIKTLEHKYRKVRIKNYFMFYFIDEESKIITISRVLYQKRNIDKLIK